MLKQTVPRTLLNADSGAMQLESEQCIDGTWVAVSDARVLRREELITDLARDSSLLVTTFRRQSLSPYISSRAKS